LGRDEPRLPQEARLQRKLRGLARPQPGSGNQPGRPGDFDFAGPESILAESKTAITRRHVIVEMAWLRKIDREARGSRKVPALIIGFENMPPPAEKDWMALPLSKMLALIKAAGWNLEVVSEG
jgi:hypothetical protein